MGNRGSLRSHCGNLRKLTKIEEEDRFAEDRSDEGSRLVEVDRLV